MEDRLPRKLAAILYADVASYSRLTGEDEDGTHRTLRAYLNLISSTVNAHEGRVVHYAGDAVLADFGTVVDALSCAVAIQRDLAERNADVSAGRKVQFRIGVNSGDVIIDQEEIYGDGVNVAARLEALAEPGGICISDAVRTAVGKKLDLTYQDMGEQHVKNIDEPVRAYRVVMSSDSSNTVTREERSTPSRSRPSVAVLPFSAIGGGQETEEFADALTDDIVSTLSRIGQCQVSDRSTTFSYKGQSPKPAQVAHDLGVDHVLQGSVRRSGNRMRITAELFSTDTQRHAWSERFDRTLNDEFQLQDEIARDISQAVRVILVYGKAGRAWQKPAQFDAWLLNVQGVEHVIAGSRDDNRQARALFTRVVEKDPNYMWGPSNVGCTHMFDCLYWWSDTPERSLEEATPFLERAVELEPNDPWPRLHQGQIAYFRGDYQESIRLVEQALDHSVDDPGLGGMGGNILCLAGLTQRAHQVLTAFVREVPHPYWPGYEFLGLCESIAGRYEEALTAFDRQIETVADPTFCYLLKAVPYLKLGQPERARAAVAHAISLRPELNLRHMRFYLGFRDPVQREQFSQALIHAGLPE